MLKDFNYKKDLTSALSENHLKQFENEEFSERINRSMEDSENDSVTENSKLNSDIKKS